MKIRGMRKSRHLSNIENGFGLFVDDDDVSAGGDTGAEGGEGTQDPKTAKADDEGQATDPKKAAAKEGGEEDPTKGLNDEIARLVKDVMKQKERAKSAQTEKDELAKQVSDIQKVLGDMSLDDVEGLIKARKDADRKRLEEQGKYEQIVEQMRDQHKTEVSDLRTKIGELEVALRTKEGSLEELSIGRAFGDSVFLREKSTIPASIARKEFGDYFDIENGVVVPYNKPRGQEDRAPLVDAEGHVKDFETAIQELFTKHPESKSLLKTTQKPGAASSTESVTAPAKPSENKTGLTGLERIQAGLQKRKAS